jgi:hypothetical protein
MKRALRPASTLGWWAFGLGLATAIWGLMVTTLPRLLHPLIESSSIRIPVGMSSVLLEIGLAVAAIVTGIVALWRGDRSWLTIVGAVLALLIGGFWILFALAEVVVPH